MKQDKTMGIVLAATFLVVMLAELALFAFVIAGIMHL